MTRSIIILDPLEIITILAIGVLAGVVISIFFRRPA